MKRIGLYLSSGPSDGGVFQYGLAMLNAIGSLPPEKFSSFVVFTNEIWREHLHFPDPKALRISNSFFERGLGGLVRRRLIPIEISRAWTPYVHSTIRLLQREACDLWVFPSQDPMSYYGELPSLVSIHDLMHRYEKRFPEVSANGQFEWREMHYRHICRFSKGVLVDSVVGRQQVHESYGLPVEKIHVLPYVAPPYVFYQSPSEDFDQTYRLPAKYIFYPAQFWEHKNHTNLLKAVHLLKSRIPDLRLVLIGGKKNAYESTKALVIELRLEDHVRFLDYVPDRDLPEFYRRATAMVMPTFFGPTNILPLEAFALDCPCAVSNIYGMPDQVGDAALLIDPSNPESIADAIERLWLDATLRKTLVERGRKKREEWNQNKFNLRFQEIIGQIFL
jgi:glycosyltransferase involved in cell wall biosynthesis